MPTINPLIPELLVDTPTRMAELHRPQEGRAVLLGGDGMPLTGPLSGADRCELVGACGSPLQRCPLHQADIPCMLCHDPGGSGPARMNPQHINHIKLVETGEKMLEVLRWRWANGCGVERPGIEADANAVRARLAQIRRGA